MNPSELGIAEQATYIHLRWNSLHSSEELRVERCNELDAGDYLSNQVLVVSYE
jgi:hypothetical protein